MIINSEIKSKIDSVHNYILRSWDKSVVYPKEADGKFKLPFPFVPPCVNGLFRCLFYWDTYFTNLGLIQDRKAFLAKNNVDNLIFLLDKYGFVPNANSVSGTTYCSQPPYLHMMIKSVYDFYHDEDWLKYAYFALKKEYDFWMNERMTEIGLNRHYHLPLTRKYLIDYYYYVAHERLHIYTNISDEEMIEKAHNYVAVAESGQDWTPRFRDCATSIIPIDLNSNLYGLENDLYNYSLKFEPELAQHYLEQFTKRKRLMDKYLLSSDGLYYDYDYKKNERKVFYTSAQFMPFISGITEDKQAIKKLLKALQQKYGITTTQKDELEENIDYQWAYPNSWAPDNFLSYLALKKCGLNEEAEKVALSYLINISETFSKTGYLWEKYDAINGGVSIKNEYEITEMLGWTAGVFEFLLNSITEK